MSGGDKMNAFDLTDEKFKVDYAENTIAHSTCHIHDYYEICYFQSGKRIYIIDGKYYNIRHNCVVLLKPFVQHSTKGNLRSTRTVIYCAKKFLRRVFSEEVIDAMLNVFNYSPVIELDKNQNHLNLLFKQIEHNYKTGDVYLAALNLGEILLSFSKSCADNRPYNIKNPETNNESEMNSGLIQQVLSYITENIGNVISVKEIADAVHFSPSYLSSLFKKITGFSVMSYVINVRVNLAAKELATTKSKLMEIGLKYGFASNTHFCNTFKKYYNLSPSAYRAYMQSSKKEN